MEGDSGAPLGQDEPEQIERNYEGIRPFMRPEGREAVREQGFAVIDGDGDLGTPLIDKRDCAYSIQENGVLPVCHREGMGGRENPLFASLFPAGFIRFG